MATLLTRLREWPDNPLCIEAADEIERLRFELKAKTAELEIADEQIERQSRSPLTGRDER